MGNPLTTFKDQGVQPPARFYVTQSEFLVLKILSSVANPALTVTSRLIGPDGSVVRNLDAIGAVTAGVISTQLFKLGEGFLLDVCVSNYGGSIQRGQTFVSVGIQFGGASGQTPFECLAADYATNTMPVTWPGGLIRSSVDGPGFLTSATSTAVAGANIVYTAPAAKRQRLISLRTQYVIGAGVANRFCFVNIADAAGNDIFHEGDQQTLTAGRTVDVSAASGQGTNFVDTFNAYFNLPPQLFLKPSWVVTVGASSIQAGDQFNTLGLALEEWVEA
jgi:hypothetical protein